MKTYRQIEKEAIDKLIERLNELPVEDQVFIFRNLLRVLKTNAICGGEESIKLLERLDKHVTYCEVEK